MVHEYNVVELVVIGVDQGRQRIKTCVWWGNANRPTFHGIGWALLMSYYKEETTKRMVILDAKKNTVA